MRRMLREPGRMVIEHYNLGTRGWLEKGTGDASVEGRVGTPEPSPFLVVVGA